MTVLSIIEPMAATLTTNRGSGVENLATVSPREVFVDQATTANTVISVDLGAVRTIDTLALLSVQNALADLGWRVGYGIASASESVLFYKIPFRVPDAADEVAQTTAALWIGPPVSARYLELTIVKTTLSASPITIGRLVVGRSVAPSLGREWGHGRQPVDLSTVTPLSDGGYSVVEGARKRRMQWTFGDLSIAETDALERISRNLGVSKPGLVVEDAQVSAGLIDRIWYARFATLRPWERRNRSQTRWEFEVEEWK